MVEISQTAVALIPPMRTPYTTAAMTYSLDRRCRRRRRPVLNDRAILWRQVIATADLGGVGSGSLNALLLGIFYFIARGGRLMGRKQREKAILEAIWQQVERARTG